MRQYVAQSPCPLLVLSVAITHLGYTVGFAAAIVFALDALEATTLPARELFVVCIAHISPIETKVDAVIPDKEFFFLLIGWSKLSTLSRWRKVCVRFGAVVWW